MDLNTVLIWTVGLSSGLLMVRALRRPRGGAAGWVWISAGLSALLGVAWWIAPELAGYLAGAPWLVLLLIPSLAIRRVMLHMSREDFARARRAALVVRALHPLGDWRLMPDLLSALELAAAGRLPEAEARLQRLGRLATPLGRFALSRWYQLAGDWGGLIAWVRAEVPREVQGQEAAVLVAFGRALGELGEVDTLLDLYRAHADRPLLSTQPETRAVLGLFAAAFAGERELVRRLFAGPLAHFPADVKRFWTATAASAAGCGAEAESELGRLELDPETSAAVLRGVARRRARPPRPHASSPEAAQTLAQMAEDVDALAHTGTLTGPPPRPARATVVVAGLLLVAFLFELPGGSTDLENLHRLGALLIPIPPGEIEPWRFFTAGLLHYGPLHLGLNTLGLLFIGRYVEKVVGARWFLGVYLGSGPLALGVVALVAALRSSAPTILVGASGSVMGLIGAAVAIHWVSWRRSRARVRPTHLLELLALIALQTVFDLMTPEVSFLAHAGGTLAGLGIGLVAARRVLVVRARRTDLAGPPDGGGERSSR